MPTIRFHLGWTQHSATYGAMSRYQKKTAGCRNGIASCHWLLIAQLSAPRALTVSPSRGNRLVAFLSETWCCGERQPPNSLLPYLSMFFAALFSVPHV